MKHLIPLALFMLLSSPIQAAEKIMVAQYLADVDDVSWRVGSDAETPGFSDGVTEPWGLSDHQAGSTFQQGLQLGNYRLSGVFDIYHRQSYAGESAYNRESAVTIGSGFQFSPNSITRLFHSLSDEQAMDEANRSRWGGDSQTQRTGLTQTWYFARRKAHISLGYEFEHSETEDLYDELRGHSIVLSSRFPLFWGLSARIQADYAHNSYQEFLGAEEVDSNKQLFRAAIDRSLSRRLYGELQFSYLNEDFEDAELSYSRYVWGLNLRYKY